MKKYKWLALAVISIFSFSSFGSTFELLEPNQWIHLGDSTSATWPDSVGATWTATFELSALATEDGTLSFKHIESDPVNNKVFINNVLVGMLTESDGTLDRDPYDPTEWVDQVITIPLNLLTLDTNTLKFECGQSFPGTSYPYDDFLLRDMTVNVVPEPASIALLGLGVLLFSRKKSG